MEKSERLAFTLSTDFHNPLATQDIIPNIIQIYINSRK